ncbi:MAG: thioredoxin family protein [Planctomycetota bacterium]
MVMVNSTMMPIGTKAPNFALPDTEGRTLKLADFEGKKGLLVIFMCNHCPFVVHLRESLAATTKAYAEKGVAVVAISSNDVENYPDDSPEKMKEEKASAGYDFPYLYDESQAVAKAYRAACTPDFFLFDGEQELYYRGQYDSSRPGNDNPITGDDLNAAVDAMLGGQASPNEQRPSAGCNIKWKAGEEPDYFPK